jgi:ABC-type iron transport system FetAB ATPase subunit
MTYEEYLDEVTTLITEKYNVSDSAAIKLVVKAQDAEFFVAHDKNEAMRTIDRAHQDAKTIYQASQKK